MEAPDSTSSSKGTVKKLSTNKGNNIGKNALKKEIVKILKDADLNAYSAKIVRVYLQEKLNVDLTHRKKEIDHLTMEVIHEQESNEEEGQTIIPPSEQNQFFYQNVDSQIALQTFLQHMVTQNLQMWQQLNQLLQQTTNVKVSDTSKSKTYLSPNNNSSPIPNISPNNFQPAQAHPNIKKAKKKIYPEPEPEKHGLSESESSTQNFTTPNISPNNAQPAQAHHNIKKAKKKKDPEPEP